ncbi:lysosomal alpha-mannosidase-like isoform X2 [Ornithodoros turicata]|uniref:lysosomal alpha-mannosidase-like isoform X2 n=1 Tax=Ornithodoros turicata TaxID=34597 RepID=UPI003139C584
MGGTAAVHLVTFFVIAAARRKVPDDKPCGVRAVCPESHENYINVHVICHSHNDAGWLETVDAIYDSAVSHIYSTTTRAMLHYPSRRYVSAENVFFSRWWNNQSYEVQGQVRELIETGRLQFVGGGWTQNDEATTHYTAIIDQVTLGLRFLNDTFGECAAVKVGWQMDPFGHSQGMASILAQMGFYGLFVGRVTATEWNRRAASKKLEFVWKASPILGRKGDLFTGITYNWYLPPHALCLTEVFCATYDNPKSISDMSKDVLQELIDQAKAYSTNNIMITLGGDLSFQSGHNWFTQIDAAIKSVNTVAKKTHKKVRLFYSSPLCYLTSLYAANKSWPVLRGDFFPYADNPQRYWTGFYSSRPNLKFYARYANGFLQACKQLSVLGGMKDARAQRLKEAVATLQHHDAITGTSKSAVVQDYALLLSKGIADCQELISDAIMLMMYPEDKEPRQTLQFCHSLNMSHCRVSEEKDIFTVIIYNPMSHAVTHFVRLPVTAPGTFNVINHKEEPVDVQVPLNMGVQEIPERQSFAKAEVVFPARVPALGYTTLQVRRHFHTERAELVLDNVVYLQLEDERRFIENSWYKIEVDTTTGLIARVTLKSSGQAMRLRQSFLLYKTLKEEQLRSTTGRNGGAYSINADHGPPLELGTHVTYRIISGKLVEEIHQIFNHWATQVVRLYKDSRYIEFEWTVGPLPDSHCSEVITRYETDLDNDGVFYTDTNGMHTIRRSIDATSSAARVASSYYPVVSWIYVQDEKMDLQMTVVPDRAQGGSSIKKGSIELMLHRRIFYDDGLGLSEQLNDRGEDGAGIMVTGKHQLLLAAPSQSPTIVRDCALSQVYRPIVMFSSESIHDIRRKHHSELNPLFPPEVHLLTLEVVSTGEILVRLEHNQHPKAVNVSISDLLGTYILTELRETLLGGNEYREGPQRFEWQRWTKQTSNAPVAARVAEGNPFPLGVLITLNPGQIRTFLCQLKKLV